MPRLRPSDSDAFRTGAPARCLLERIAHKWAVLILSTLLQSPKYFLELHRDVGGVSRKVLTEELRTLVRDGLVGRRTDVGARGVQYALTTLGKSLCGPINQLRRWAEQHADQIERAQARFDEPARQQIRSPRRLG